MFDHVDPFIGCGATDLPPAQGLAATWWWPKPQVGNTHPGATHPFGMVSAVAYSGGYPTGYGPYELNTEGNPPPTYDGQLASGFTHFQQSGTGAIRKYYNYFRITPMLESLDELGRTWPLVQESATPGEYATTLANGIRAELTVGPKSAVHRYTFGAHEQARIVLDASTGGLSTPRSRTVPLRATLTQLHPGVAQAEIVVEGVPLAVHIEVDAPGWRQLLWYDRRLMPGGTRLDFDYIRPTTLRPFGLMWMGPARAAHTVEVRLGFSLRGTARAEANLRADLAGLPAGAPAYEHRRESTRLAWREHLDLVRVDDSALPADRTTTLASALYHSFIKPSFAHDESPSWTTDGPYAFDLCTMWDIYRTQLPLLTTLLPGRAVDLANVLLTICEQEGNLPIGYRMAKGADRFSRQASALAHVFLADLWARREPGIDWEWAMVHLDADLRRTYGEDYLAHGVAHPVTHTLDLAYAYHCTAGIARGIGDRTLGDQMQRHAAGWVHAFDPATGLLIDSTFYEGGRWNYSFRLLHDMAGRIELAGGAERFVGLLDRFFGFGADPVCQPGPAPSKEELAAGYALGRFEGLNNEPDLDVPWAYHYTGRPERTAQIVHGAIANMFGAGRGGLPGNDDSGGLSAWYVWATLGLFPVVGQDGYLLGPPAVPEATIARPEGDLHLTTSGLVVPEPGGPVSYVQRVTIDGREHDSTWLSGPAARAARHIHLDLGDEPSSWGVHTRPPSTAAPVT